MLSQRGLIEDPVDTLDQFPNTLGHSKSVVPCPFVDKNRAGEAVQEVLKQGPQQGKLRKEAPRFRVFYEALVFILKGLLVLDGVAAVDYGSAGGFAAVHPTATIWHGAILARIS